MMMSGFSAEENGEQKIAPGPGLDTVADLERKLAMLRAAEANKQSTAAPAFALPAATEVKKSSSEDSKGGKSALLARIMAAQERAKQAQNPAPAAVDLLSDTPPAFDSAVLPPPPVQDQPPAFDDSFFPQAATQTPPVFSWDPHAPESSTPLPSSDYQKNNSAQSDDGNEDVIAAILAMEGMSEADKQALIEEQMKIMASIEKSRTNDRASAAHSAADAFESRSFSNNVQSVNNPSRRLHVGSAVLNASSAEEAAQLKADMELAEALQKEEYEQAERQQQRPRSRAAPPLPPAAPAPESQSWLEWMGLTSSTAPPTNTNSDAPPPYSAPGQMGGSSSIRGGYDEDEALLRNRPRARVAESQPLFACVTDSVSTALTYAVSPPPDGVDSSSLLAMPQVGRNNEYERHD